MAAMVNIHEAKTPFEAACARKRRRGNRECKSGQPSRTAWADSRADAEKRVPGIDKGKIWMAKDFDIMSEQELDDWYRS
jgi:hypothetical protein